MQPNISSWGTKEGVFKAIIVVAGLISLFLFVLSIDQIRALWKNNDIVMTSISVAGKGEVIAIPDIASFTFTVSETAKTVEQAQESAVKKTDAALKAIRDNGVEERDIKTISYSVNPRYEWEAGICTQYGCPNGKNILKGYDVSQTVEVKVRDIKKVGTLLSSVGSTGIQNISGVTFKVDDIEAVKDNAREIAIEDAKARAEVIAESLGVKVVRVTGYWEENPSYYPAYDMGYGGARAESMSVKAIPELPAGEQNIESRVSVTFEIR